MTTSDTTSPDALLLRVEEAASLLGIARTSMFHLLATREIESVRVGRLRRIPAICLTEYVDRLRREQAATHPRTDDHIALPATAAGRD